MKWTRPFPALTAALLAPAALAPQAGAQTLADALAQAYANNPALLAARAQLRAVDENVPQALAGWRPTVSIASSIGWTDSQARQRGAGVRETDRTIGSNQFTINQP